MGIEGQTRPRLSLKGGGVTRLSATEEVGSGRLGFGRMAIHSQAKKKRFEAAGGDRNQKITLRKQGEGTGRI